MALQLNSLLNYLYVWVFFCNVSWSIFASDEVALDLMQRFCYLMQLFYKDIHLEKVAIEKKNIAVCNKNVVLGLMQPFL